MQNSLINAIDDVLALESLKPSDHVNKVMSNLVQNVIDGDSTLPHENILKTIREKSAGAEGEMEQYWAHRIISSAHPTQEALAFPYAHNYVELVRRELELIKKSGYIPTKASNVLVIGSGPLPLTAIEIGKQTGASVDQLDISSEAASVGEKLCKALDFSTRYFIGDGKNVLLDRQYDIILIAALAGDTIEQKQAIIENVGHYLNGSGRIIMRSAKGLRTILYPEIKTEDIIGLRLLDEYHPTDDIINSVLIYAAK